MNGPKGNGPSNSVLKQPVDLLGRPSRPVRSASSETAKPERGRPSGPFGARRRGGTAPAPARRTPRAPAVTMARPTRVEDTPIVKRCNAPDDCGVSNRARRARLAAMPDNAATAERLKAIEGRERARSGRRPRRPAGASVRSSGAADRGRRDEHDERKDEAGEPKVTAVAADRPPNAASGQTRRPKSGKTQQQRPRVPPTSGGFSWLLVP